jgi:hypothetical protein
MYDVAKLKTLAECRTVMQRARQRNLPDVYATVFRRRRDCAWRSLGNRGRCGAPLMTHLTHSVLSALAPADRASR